MEIKKIVEGMTATEVAQVIDDNFKAAEKDKANKTDVNASIAKLTETVETNKTETDARIDSNKEETDGKLSELGSEVGMLSDEVFGELRVFATLENADVVKLGGILSNGKRDGSSNYNNYYFTNNDYSVVSAFVGSISGSTNAAIAFYDTAEILTDDTIYENSCIGTVLFNGVQEQKEYKSNVPEGCAMIVVTCRIDKFPNHTVDLYKSGDGLKKTVKDIGKDLSSTKEVLDEFKKGIDVVENSDINIGETIEIIDKDGSKIVEVTNVGVDVKSLTVKGEAIITKKDIDKILYEDNDTTTKDCVDFEDEEGNVCVSITKNGLKAKSISLLNGEGLDYGYNILKGKKWVVVGDSFSTNADETITDDSYIKEGKYKGQLKDYGYIIGNRNNMNIVNFHSGGKTMAYPKDGMFANSFCNPNASYTKAYKDIPLDADYITIQLGINDQSHMIQESGDGEDVTGRINLGDENSTDTSTFYGAWNTAMEWILTNLPFAHVGIIITNGLGNANGSWADGGYEYDARNLYEAEKTIAKRWGVPILDLNGDERCPMMHRGYNPNLCKKAIQLRLAAFTEGAIGTHPNSKAYEYESTFIENFLRSL